MSKGIAKPDPAQFTMASFADLLSTRGVIAGEHPGSFDNFHEGNDAVSYAGNVI